MPTVSARATATVTLTYDAIINLSVDPNESVVITVLRAGVQVFGHRTSRSQSVGPFLGGDVVYITAQKGAADYTLIQSGTPDVIVVNVGTGDSGPRIQAVLDRVKAAGRRSTPIMIVSSGVVTLDTGIIVDPWFHDVDFDGATVTYTPTTGVAITIQGTTSNAFTQIVGGVQNLNLRGQVTGTSTGILFTGSAVATRTSASLRKVTTYGFDIGIDFFNYGYLTHFHDVIIDGSTTNGLRQRIGEDAGENISWHGGAISNGAGVAILAQDDTTEIKLYGVSIDYNVRCFDIQNGRVEMHGGHIEFNGGTAVNDQIKCAGQSSFRMFGGYWVVNTIGGAGPYAYSHLVNVVDTNSQVIFYKTHFVNHRNTSDQWAVGNGQVTTDLITFNVPLMPYRFFAGNNLLIDGGGEQTTPRDFWYVYADATGAGASRMVGASGMAVTTDAAPSGGGARTGARSFRLRKGNVGTSTAQTFAIIIPVTGLAGRRMCANLWAQSDSASGLHQMSLLWGALRNQDAIERPVWAREDAFATNFFSAAIPAATSPANWTQVAINNGGLIVPRWATHLQLRIDLTLTTALSSVWIDDFTVEAI
jgi:hypothetical protein